MSSNPNQGALFPNKKTKDTQPDFKGKLTIAGVEWSIAAWNRHSKAGNDYLSLVAEVPSAHPSSKSASKSGVASASPSNPPASSSQPPAPTPAPVSPAPAPADQADPAIARQAKVDKEFGDLFDGLD